MGDYAQLDALVGKLKQSACDAFVHDHTYNQFLLNEGDYTLYTEAYGEGCNHEAGKLTRPDSSGNGGGVFTLGAMRDDSDVWNPMKITPNPPDPAQLTAYFQGQFDAIRNRIDNAIAPWRTTADPDTIQSCMDTCRVVMRDLDVQPTTSHGEQTGTSELASCLQSIQMHADSMTGATIAAFKEKFLVRLPATVQAQQQIAALLGSSLGAEYAMWKEARSCVPDIVDKAQQACAKIANGSSLGGWDILLKVASLAVQGALIFATDDLATGLKVAALGLNATKDALPTEKVDDSPSSCEAALSAFEDALRRTSKQLFDGEQQVEENLSKNMSNFQVDMSTTYSLAVVPISSGRELHIDKPTADELVNTNMPDLAKNLAGAAREIRACMFQAQRDASLGWGPNGPSDKWYQMRDLLADMVDKLSWQVTTGNEDLKAARSDFTHHDAKSASNLAAIAKRLSRGNGIDLDAEVKRDNGVPQHLGPAGPRGGKPTMQPQ